MPSLGNDLADIRKEQKLTLNDIHEATKIPKHILNAIEDDSIFSEFEKNPTYIRSYIRSYAKALSIEEEKIIYALDKKQKDNYQGSLQELLEDGPKPTFELDEGDEQHEATDSDDDEHEAAKDEPAEPEPTPIAKPSTLESESDVHSVDWVDMGQRFQPLESTKSKVWVGIIAIIIIVASGTYVYFYEFSNAETSANVDDNQPTEVTDEAVSADSLQLDIVPSTESDTSVMTESSVTTTEDESLETLPDTLSMVIYAAYGKLEPVRVYSDVTDSINPYWIEESEAIRFEFINEIQIRGQYSRMVLLLNGHVVPNFRETFYNPDSRLLEIDRSYFEGDSTWLQPPPDSLAIDAPSPSVIKERPTFN
ncbi:helix-turn-helix domain-containing protein [Fodinibius halophilus]|uniref:Helix-turn-helix domain-containing protein n=1 Tax=Fodinibius halophilus TaxID=1736908 RepID=A0A6M1SXU6_9BACT|nr:helix-turn-helix transcriptional regulator [Fodinibius halophilus]NGP88226.1 helix-turn-helix domain-containing protein [Fodinibius halophilus]